MGSLQRFRNFRTAWPAGGKGEKERERGGEEGEKRFGEHTETADQLCRQPLNRG